MKKASISKKVLALTLSLSMTVSGMALAWQRRMYMQKQRVKLQVSA